MQAALNYFVKPTGFRGIQIGKAIHIYPQAHMVDILMFDGSIFKEVQVVSMSASSSSGSSELPAPVYESERETNYFDPAKQTETDVFAVVGFVGNQMRPICLGFLFPEECEILCDRTQAGNEDGTMFLWKHPSNVYFRVAKGKDLEEGKTPELEISHPSGLFIRIGVPLDDGGSPAIPIVRGITNYGNIIRPFKKLNPESGEADPIPTVRLYHPSGTTIFIDAEGSVTVNVKKDVTTTIIGNVTETITGNVSRTINGQLNEHVVGKVEITYDDDLESVVGGNETREVTGSETDTIGTTWQREAGTSIKDEAPRIDHN